MVLQKQRCCICVPVPRQRASKDREIRKSFRSGKPAGERKYLAGALSGQPGGYTPRESPRKLQAQNNGKSIYKIDREKESMV